MSKPSLLLMLAFSLSGCTRHSPPPTLAQIAEDFIYAGLALSPVQATSVGFHDYKGVPLDELLDDYSASAINGQRRFYNGFRKRLADGIKVDSLSPEDRADFDILQDQISAALFELDTIQSYRHNPTIYVELIGNALFNPLVLEYAPKPKRVRHIIRRLAKIPALIDQAKSNLIDAPAIWNTVAQQENDGNISLIDQTIRGQIPEEWRPRYDAIARIALDSLRGFNGFLKNDLSKKTMDWRMGREKYAQKFRLILATGQAPEQMLAEAEAKLQAIRGEMQKLAGRLYSEQHPGRTAPAGLNALVSATLDRVAEKHATPDSYFADARRDLAEAREFVQAKGLLRLPSRDNLKVIETPEFMRGIYSVGGFNSAPLLEPHLGAFYWITPIPKDWPAARIDSKMREYNYYGLKILTIHEAMPGHYVQAEYANDIEPKSRRLARGIFANGPYVEGWAVYATELMLNQGYLDNSPALRLTFYKQMLRVIANTILDIRLQTMGMTGEQALALMIDDTFQEKEEATSKLQRAQLSSCQLPTYFAGWRGWNAARDHYKAAKGADFKLTEFHEKALKEGAVPLPVLARLLGGSAAR